MNGARARKKNVSAEDKMGLRGGLLEGDSMRSEREHPRWQPKRQQWGDRRDRDGHAWGMTRRRSYGDVCDDISKEREKKRLYLAAHKTYNIKILPRFHIPPLPLPLAKPPRMPDSSPPDAKSSSPTPPDEDPSSFFSSSTSSPTSSPTSIPSPYVQLSPTVLPLDASGIPDDPCYIAAGSYFPEIDEQVGQLFAVKCPRDKLLAKVESWKTKDPMELRVLKLQIKGNIVKFPWKKYDQQSEKDKADVNCDLVLYAVCNMLLGGGPLRLIKAEDIVVGSE